MPELSAQASHAGGASEQAEGDSFTSTTFLLQLFLLPVLRESLLVPLFAGEGEVSMSLTPGPQLPPGAPHPSFFARPDEVDVAQWERHAPEPGKFAGAMIPPLFIGVPVSFGVSWYHC